METDNPKKKDIILLVFLILALFTVNYSFLDSLLINFLDEKETVHIDRVIDGDTIVSNDTHIRLLGINSPERGEKYYDEAGVFLENLVLNKTVGLEFGKSKKDKYGRTLAYVYFNNKNVNLELVKEGLANHYFPSGKDKQYDNFIDSWSECVENYNKNLCESSNNPCASCIELKDFDYKNEIITLKNNCSFDCDLTSWSIKDEGRKSFVFPEFMLKKEKEGSVTVGEGKNNGENLYWSGEDYVWTKSGDTLFLRDSDGKLILWRNY